MILFIIWYFIVALQLLFAYGTAYRLTKKGGDNGAALFGWFIAINIASIIPGLGIYLWFRHKDTQEV